MGLQKGGHVVPIWDYWNHSLTAEWIFSFRQHLADTSLGGDFQSTFKWKTVTLPEKSQKMARAGSTFPHDAPGPLEGTLRWRAWRLKAQQSLIYDHTMPDA